MTERTEERDFRSFRKTGDPEAMARVFDAVAPKLLLVAGHLTRDAAEAEDLVQTTFLQALQDAQRWDGERPLVPWLVGILSHRAADRRRRSRLRSAGELEEVAAEALDPLELVSDQELREEIARSVDRLEEPYREVLILRVAHGLEPTEIAHSLGRSPGTVRMQLKRGREQLERALPRGLQLPAFLLADPGRGLAAVREVVLAKASAAAAATATVSTVSTVGAWTLGGLAMKAVMVAVGVFGLSVIFWSLFGPRPEREVASRERRAGETPIERAEELEAPDEALETAGAAALPEKRVLASLAPGLEIAVRVTFEEDGTPARNVGVYVRPARAGALGVEARTDGTGTARFDDLERGRYRIDLDRWDRESVEVELSRGRTIELTIPDGIDVTGFVVDPRGDAVPGADVFRLNRGHHDYLQWIATADTAGIFRLRDVAPDTAFVARAEGHQPSSLGRKRWRAKRAEGSAGGSAEVEIVVGARGHRVGGRVVDGRGRPAAHARIVFAVEEDTRSEGVSRLDRDPERKKPADLEAFAVRADENGTFESREVPAGSVTYLACSTGEEAEVAVGALEVIPEEEHELEIVLGPGAGVVGFLTDESGRPMKDFVIQHEWRGSVELGQMEHELGELLANRSTATAEDGSFQLLGLLPGETGLEVRHPNGDELVRERVELELGELHRWTPSIELPGELTARLVGPSGEPLAGWGVGLCGWPSSLRFADRDGRTGRAGFVPNATDAGGRYRFVNVRPRGWFLSAHPPTPEGALVIPPPVAVREGVHPGGQEVLLQVGSLPTASVRGRVLDPAGAVPKRSGSRTESPAEIQVRLANFDECGKQELDENGHFELDRLPAGAYALVLNADGFPRDYELATFELAPGQGLDLGLLTPPAPASVAVEVVAEDGRPLGQMTVALHRDGDDYWWTQYQNERDADDPEGPIRLDEVTPGSCTLVVRGHGPAGFAPHHERIELAPGQHLRKTITVSRGREQTFELSLPPHPSEERRGVFSAPSARIDVEVWDTGGHFILRERDRFALFDVPGNRLRITRRLAPGSYRMRFEDHRDPPLRQPRPSAEIEVVVPATGDPDVLLVELR